MLSEPKSQALADLGQYLKNHNYQFITVTPQTHQYYLKRHENRLAENLRDVFGWCLPFSKDLLEDELWQLMVKADVLQQDDKNWRSAVRWSTLKSSLFVHSAFPTDQSDAVFFGPDTYRFALAIEEQLQHKTDSIQSVVDIGCGSGVGAVYASLNLPEAEVMAVDINPKALGYTQANAKLNGADKVSAYKSNLLDAVDGDFDLIIANPPYMHDSAARAYRHGGAKMGAELSLKIVDAAMQRLAPGGSLLLYTGVAVVDGKDLFLDELSQRVADNDWRWNYHEMDPDVFGEELLKADYNGVERIAAVVLTLSRSR